jgi:hypothetical protein
MHREGVLLVDLSPVTILEMLTQLTHCRAYIGFEVTRTFPM